MLTGGWKDAFGGCGSLGLGRGEQREGTDERVVRSVIGELHGRVSNLSAYNLRGSLRTGLRATRTSDRETISK